MSRHDRRGQSEVLAVALLLSVSLLSAGLLTVAGSNAVDQTGTNTRIEGAENTMALFDTRASIAVLGGRDPQTLRLGGARGGEYEVRPDAGWIRITHVNASGPGTADEVLYNGTMGSVVYVSDDTEIAYQAGGVWRREPGGSVLLSPPELSYRGSTLTFPAIGIDGERTAGSGVSATIVPERASVAVYPNESERYAGSTRPYLNPVENGSVQVTVHSRYYEGWVDYFRTQTTGDVTAVHDGNETAVVALRAGGILGEFGMPSHGDAIRLRGLGDQHAVDEFTVTLQPDEGDDADFANMAWELRASTPRRTLVLRVESHGKVCPDSDIDATVVYEESDGTRQTWEREDAFSENATAFAYSCAGGEPTLDVNFTGATELTYEDGESPTEFDHDEDGEPEQFSHGQDTTIDQLVNHYLALFDSSVDLVVRDEGVSAGDGNAGNGADVAGSVSESASFGTLLYDRDGQVVTYLRVTESRVRVELS